MTTSLADDLYGRRAGIDPDELPDEMMISAITTAELSVGVLAAGGAQELAQRMKILQTAEAEFDPLPFDDNAAREYGQLWIAVIAPGVVRLLVTDKRYDSNPVHGGSRDDVIKE